MPQGQYPIVNLEGGWNRNNQCCRRKEVSKIGIHSADIHVMRPHDEAEQTDNRDSPDHHPVAENVFPGMNADQIGHNSEGRKRNDVNFRMTKEPEKMLEQYGAAAAIFELLSE